MERFIHTLERMQADNIPISILAYVALHHQSGCRISDLLAVDFSSITQQLNISINQGKGSLALLVQPLYYRDYWKNVRDNKLQPMSAFNRFFFYRLYKKYDLVHYSGSGKNNSVTHSFRKSLATDVYSLNQNIGRVQGALGHRSSKSSEHYVVKTDS